MVTTKTYLYLTKRDKKGVKVLASFKGPKYPAVRIDDIKKLNLPTEVTQALEKTIHEHRMHWELWLEGGDFKEIKTAWVNRGYSELPVHPTPIHSFRNGPEFVADVRSVKPHKTMLRRGGQAFRT